MKKTHLYLLVVIASALGLAAMAYKWQVLQFPIQANAEVEVWTIQARVEYRPRRGPNAVTLQLPSYTPGFSVLDERFVARNYSKLEEARGIGREVQWATRRATGNQSLYYRATVVRSPRKEGLEAFQAQLPPDLPQPEPLPELRSTAAQTLLDQVRDRSADVLTYARELVRRFAQQDGEEVAILLDGQAGPDARAKLIVDLLAFRNIPARVIHALELGHGEAQLKPWLMVHNGAQWFLINLSDASEGWPSNLFLWSASDAPVLYIEGNAGAALSFQISRNLADAMATAERRLEVHDANLVRYSLLSLPLQTQEVYRVLMMVPIGAFLMLVLRNLVGVRTFGTFMPVLVALAFRDTGLIAGVILFVLVVGTGLLARFYLERLRLLLVPRLTAVLIIVVLLMALVSVLANRLGIEVGLSVALFPMVIMAMTIERMSVAWEERGAGNAMKDGFGTLVVAAVAYVVMSWPPLVHLVFVFPEVLLVLFALTLMLGRYAGYRLSELFRFRALARDPDPIAPPPDTSKP